MKLLKLPPPKSKKYEKPSVLRTTAGIGLGAGVYEFAAKQKIAPAACAKKMLSMCGKLTNDEFKAVKSASDRLLDVSGLKKFGTEILTASAENIDKIKDAVSKDVEAGFTRKLPAALKKYLKNIQTASASSGVNAFCLLKENKIIMPEGRGMSLSVFHEAGHAMNRNMSFLGKALQKCRPLGLLAVPIALIGIFKSKKAEGEQPQGAFDKTLTFVKNHSGKLASLCMLPMLAEEGLASLKGNKLAAKMLTPELAAKVSKFNKFGFLSYAAVTAGIGLAAYLGKTIRDIIASPKEAEQQ